MLKWFILAVAAYLLYRLFSNEIKKKFSGESKEDMERKVASGEMVKDPECGAYVSPDSTITVRDGATVHYFCSYECRDKFLKRLENGGRVIPEKSSLKDEDN